MHANVMDGCQVGNGGGNHDSAGRNEISLLSSLATSRDKLFVVIPVSSVVSILTGGPVEQRAKGTTEKEAIDLLNLQSDVITVFTVLECTWLG